MRYHQLGELIKLTIDFHSSGIKGESQMCQIANGKYELKHKVVFNAIKWSINICSILLGIYIICKALY